MATNMFDARLAKGDLEGALNQALIEADNAKAIAQQGLDTLPRQRDRIEALGAAALSKYQLL